ncbi:MAG: diacylglycerol kinase family protein [Bacilli bacterium]|nr:diacylglycerol kinase family protein [Bacilli bacterium]
MKLEPREERKKMGFARMIRSFGYSFDGIKYAYKNEQSVSLMIIATIFVLVFGFICKITTIEWFFILISIGLVLGTELINTSIEATIDLLSPEYHPLAKIAKDTGSAAVFILSVVSFLIGAFVFVPNFLELLGIR